MPTQCKQGRVKVRAGAEGHQSQESRRPSDMPAGIAGAAGCPEHHAPEQGRDPGGRGSGADRSAHPVIDGSSWEASRAGSVREVTRWEHPPSAPGGADNAIARSTTTAPVGTEADCLRIKDLVITPGPEVRIPAGAGKGRNGVDEIVEYQEA